MDFFPWLVILALVLMVVVRTGALARTWNYLRQEERPMTIDELESRLDPDVESAEDVVAPFDP